MPGWPRWPSDARSLRTWASVRASASPSVPLETLVVPSRSNPSSCRRYRLSRCTLARDIRGSTPVGPRPGGSTGLLMLRLSFRPPDEARGRAQCFSTVTGAAGRVKQPGAQQTTVSRATRDFGPRRPRPAMRHPSVRLQLTPHMAQPPPALDLVRVAPALPPRADDSHKGDFGRVLVAAGSRGMSGAAVLCASAALRGGAGLVRLAVPAGILPIVAAANPCYMTAPLPEDIPGQFAAPAAPALVALLLQHTTPRLPPA